ncbi:Methyltransferase domain-containing protein [Sanguibacter gelidistatuariae]|uniref:Methyltransferase domain-containing protein n=1 Tax=Sanguibacter gelidistatuariae TaxID=1814289 RepID=A0A1G6GZ90_9MICO|nr:class I SAM-dependent methyltransferase [Sanguibacter gelidistatuariae]SDB87370.1 Methyltransferase domain-containing protein [Sanguibacter gelidistatuariae]
MRTPTLWEQNLERNPSHSLWYLERMRSLAAGGKDLAGEARTIDAMVPRGARVLDAGCGPGRVGAALVALGHTVVGIDVDPVLINAAIEDHPGVRWLVGDLAEMDLAAHQVTEGFDAIVCAGNVMTFLAPGTHVTVLENMRRHLSPSGRIVVGFGAGRGYLTSAFLDDVASAGLAVDALFSTWDLRPHNEDSDFLVAVLSS